MALLECGIFIDADFEGWKLYNILIAKTLLFIRVEIMSISMCCDIQDLLRHCVYGIEDTPTFPAASGRGAYATPGRADIARAPPSLHQARHSCRLLAASICGCLPPWGTVCWTTFCTAHRDALGQLAWIESSLLLGEATRWLSSNLPLSWGLRHPSMPQQAPTMSADNLWNTLRNLHFQSQLKAVLSQGCFLKNQYNNQYITGKQNIGTW